MGPFKPTSQRGYKFVSKITNRFTKWSAVYLFCSKINPMPRLSWSSLPP